MTPTTQFRIPSDLKSLFKDICTYNNVSMCEVVIHQIQSYIHKETRDQSLVRHLRAKETATTDRSDARQQRSLGQTRVHRTRRLEK